MNISPVSIDGQKVGEVIDGLVYFTKRVPAKHLFRGGKKTVKEAMAAGTGAWGIDGGALDYLKDSGVQVVCVETPDKVYWTSMKTLTKDESDGGGYWLSMSGNGLQRFMRLNRWNVAKSVKDIVALAHQVTGRVVA